MIRVVYALLSIFIFSSSHAGMLKDVNQSLSDSFITAKIKLKFTENKLINPLKVRVKTHKGIVQLKGNVANAKAYWQALKIAKNTKGVVACDPTELEVKKQNLRLTDAYITTKVEAAILKTKIIHDESIPLIEIAAHTKNGVVTLSGIVKKKSSIKTIVKNVARVHGVKKVITDLKVSYA